jgi:hypothetical protein
MSAPLYQSRLRTRLDRWEGTNYLGRVSRATKLFSAGVGSIILYGVYWFALPTEYIRYPDLPIAALRAKWGKQKGQNVKVYRAVNPEDPAVKVQYFRLTHSLILFEPKKTYIFSVCTDEVDLDSHNLRGLHRKRNTEKLDRTIPRTFAPNMQLSDTFETLTVRVVMKVWPQTHDGKIMSKINADFMRSGNGLEYNRFYHHKMKSEPPALVRTFIREKKQTWRNLVEREGYKGSFASFFTKECQEDLTRRLTTQFEPEIIVDEVKLVIENGDTSVKDEEIKSTIPTYGYKVDV